MLRLYRTTFYRDRLGVATEVTQSEAPVLLSPGLGCTTLSRNLLEQFRWRMNSRKILYFFLLQMGLSG